jgi:hypothetical protein
MRKGKKKKKTNLADAAVTRPSGLKTGFSFAISATFVLGFACSSELIISGPFLPAKI